MHKHLSPETHLFFDHEGYPHPYSAKGPTDSLQFMSSNQAKPIGEDEINIHVLKFLIPSA